MNNTEENFGYFAKTVSERLGIAKDTLRSWSLKLEAEGVKFERNAREQRIYYEKDIRALENMKELMDLQQPLNDVSKTIANKIEKSFYIGDESINNTEITPSVSQGENALITQEKQMQNFKKELIQELSTKQSEMMEQFKNDLTKEISTVMQDRFEHAVNEAVKMALLQERKEIKMQVIQEIEENALQIASGIEKTNEKGFLNRLKRLFG
ncbi:MerR family transcriptional regulator [Peribacillus frigoritolerans]|uniref:MerR family transcriptional regulator n=1 Tax=Peribacillus frigoritolerans TaxID=450367 RepID=UPI002B060471|nr:MerR family transcriptional regulator [Peribacillus frigoritolerans]MEA3577711.1 MerR family transcriptional regulator [Peribacillus frigoritolerans]